MLRFLTELSERIEPRRHLSQCVWIARYARYLSCELHLGKVVSISFIWVSGQEFVCVETGIEHTDQKIMILVVIHWEVMEDSPFWVIPFVLDSFYHPIRMFPFRDFLPVTAGDLSFFLFPKFFLLGFVTICVTPLSVFIVVGFVLRQFSTLYFSTSRSVEISALFGISEPLQESVMLIPQFS